jgi:hypothetical protein
MSAAAVEHTTAQATSSTIQTAKRNLQFLYDRTHKAPHTLLPPYPPLHAQVPFLATSPLRKICSRGCHHSSNSRNSDRECGLRGRFHNCTNGNLGRCRCGFALGVGQVRVEDVGEEGEEWGGAWR